MAGGTRRPRLPGRRKSPRPRRITDRPATAGSRPWSPRRKRRPAQASGAMAPGGLNPCGGAVGTASPAPYQLFRNLPDAHAIGRIEVKSLSRLCSERGVPRVHVAHRVRPLRAWRVRIRQQLLAKRRLAAFAPPDLGPAEVEALVC